MALTYGPILVLYKSLLREASKFHSFIFRRYFIRRIKDGFHENKNLTDQEKIDKLIAYARQNLEVLRRQAAISNFYKMNKTVTEP